MKIAYLSTDTGIPVLGNKGSSVHVREVCLALQELGNEVFIVTSNRGNYPVDFPLPIYEVKPLTAKLLGSDFRKIITNRRFYKEAGKIFRKEKPDFIYERYELFGFAGIKLARKFRLPHLLEVNAPLRWGPKRRIKFPWLAKSIENRIFSSTRGIILTTRELEEYVLGNGGNKERVWVNPDGVDVDKFHPGISGEKIREKYNLQDRIVVGFVGTIGHWHRVDLLLSVAREVVRKEPRVHFLIVGGAASLASLKEYAVKKKLNGVVTFTGNVPYQEVPYYIAAMDITVLPGTDIYSSPIKIFEYMAMGKPVIAPRIGQLEEIISDGREGFLIEQGNKNQLQECIIKLAGSKILGKEMGQRGRSKVEKEYTWRKNGEKICSIYEKLLTEEKAGK